MNPDICWNGSFQAISGAIYFSHGLMKTYHVMNLMITWSMKIFRNNSRCSFHCFLLGKMLHTKMQVCLFFCVFVCVCSTDNRNYFCYGEVQDTKDTDNFMSSNDHFSLDLQLKKWHVKQPGKNTISADTWIQ